MGSNPISASMQLLEKSRTYRNRRKQAGRGGPNSCFSFAFWGRNSTRQRGIESGTANACKTAQEVEAAKHTIGMLDAIESVERRYEGVRKPDSLWSSGTGG
jgi:hypothetical protein